MLRTATSRYNNVNWKTDHHHNYTNSCHVSSKTVGISLWCSGIDWWSSEESAMADQVPVHHVVQDAVWSGQDEDMAAILSDCVKNQSMMILCISHRNIY